MVYSRIRLSSTNIQEELSELSRAGRDDKDGSEIEALLGLSLLLNVVATRVLACVERKWNTGAMGLLIGSSAEMTGKLLSTFANASRAGGTSRAVGPGEGAAQLEGGGAESSEEKEILALQSPDGPSSAFAVVDPTREGAGETPRKVSRSWDGFLEEFTRG